MIHAYIPHGWVDVERYEALRQKLLEQRAAPAKPQRRAAMEEVA